MPQRCCQYHESPGPVRNTGEGRSSQPLRSPPTYPFVPCAFQFYDHQQGGLLILRPLECGGPGRAAPCKQINGLTHGETNGQSDVCRCLSHRVVPNDRGHQASRSDFAPLEHSIYVGRRRLGRYVRIGVRLYAAYGARDQLLGCFTKRANALAAIDCATAEPER
jgi:hypothetical protein